MALYNTLTNFTPLLSNLSNNPCLQANRKPRALGPAIRWVRQELSQVTKDQSGRICTASHAARLLQDPPAARQRLRERSPPAIPPRPHRNHSRLQLRGGRLCSRHARLVRHSVRKGSPTVKSPRHTHPIDQGRPQLRVLRPPFVWTEANRPGESSPNAELVWERCLQAGHPFLHF